MRLIKRQTTNLRSIRGSGVQYDVNDQVILDSKKGVLVPRGMFEDRPFYPENGYIRYNTESNEFEGYQDGAWRKFRFKEPTSIVQQNLGRGNLFGEDTFGPLDNGDPDFPAPLSGPSMLVFVENVFQIHNTNYTLVQNPPGNSPTTGAPYAPGYYIVFGTPPPVDKPVTVLHNFDK